VKGPDIVRGSNSATRKRSRHESTPIRLVEFALALLLGVAAATRHAWYDASPKTVQLRWLAPRGALVEPPHRLVWHANVPVHGLQLECQLHDGSPRHIRRCVVAASGGTIEFTNDERTAIAAAGGAALVVVAIAADGRGLAPPLHGTVTLKRGLSPQAPEPLD